MFDGDGVSSKIKYYIHDTAKRLTHIMTEYTLNKAQTHNLLYILVVYVLDIIYQ